MDWWKEKGCVVFSLASGSSYVCNDWIEGRNLCEKTLPSAEIKRGLKDVVGCLCWLQYDKRSLPRSCL